MTETQPASGVSFLDPAVLDDPFPAYAELHARCPVHHDPSSDQYVVVGYDELRTAATDPDTFSSRRRKGSGRATPGMLAHAAVLAERGWARTDTLQRTDPPVHTRYRRLLARAFTPKRVAELEPRIRQVMGELADRLAETGGGDFVTEVALPLPGIVIAEQIGLDQRDYETFKRWADAMLALANRPGLGAAEAAAEAEVELEAQHHLARLFAERRAEPGDDLISLLVNAHDDDEPLTVEELQDLLHQLVTGGFETTTSGLAAGLWLLLRHPDQMDLVRRRPELIPNLVEEVLRVDSPVQGLWRTATEPVDVGGVRIPAGSTVQLRFGAANHDPRRFDDPDRFDVERADAGAHVAFGMGPHFCVGAALARTELRVAFETMLERFDTIELARPVPTPAHEPSVFLRPLRELHIRVA